MGTRLDKVVSEANRTWQTEWADAQVDKAELLPQVGPRLCQPLQSAAPWLHLYLLRACRCNESWQQM